MELAADDVWQLRQYAKEQNQAAFSAVVRRYVGLVYSSALRRVGSRETAEDVTQAVFMILSKKASQIRSDRPLLRHTSRPGARIA